MSMKSVSATAKVAASIAGLLLGGTCFAQATWNWGDPGGCDPETCTVSGVTATVKAFGSEGLDNLFQSAVVRDLDPYNGNGLGIASTGENSTSPNHSIDNFKWNYQSTYQSSVSTGQGGADYAEVLAINFSQAVALTQVAVSWTYTDSDALIFRYDGAGVPPNLTGITASALPTTVGSTNSGWTLVSSGQFATGSQYNNGAAVGFLNMTPNLSLASSYSSYWLVSTAFGSGNNDGFKLLAFSGHIKPNGGGGSSVPEPGSLGLAAAAFFGLAASRRRKTAHR